MFEVMTIANAVIQANAPQDYTIAIAIIGGLATLAAAIISGIVSGIKGAGSAAKSFIEKYDHRVEKLADTVKHLESEKFGKLEITVHEHLKEDKSQGLQVELKKMNESIAGIGGEVKTIGLDVAGLKGLPSTIQRLIDSDTIQSKEIATLAEARRGDRSFIENINTAFQNCKTKHHL